MIVYKITNSLNGLAYVGLSVHDGRTRWRGHLMNARKQHPQQLVDKAIRKHGAENFVYEVIETIDRGQAVAYLEQREQFWIHKLKTFDRRFGYNLSLGTYTNVGHTRTRAYRQAAKERTAVGVHQYTLEGKYLRSFSAINEAARSCKVSPSSITNALRISTGSAAGYLWVRATSASAPVQLLPFRYRRQTRAKKVYCFTKLGVAVGQYPSAKDAANALGVPFKAISEALNGGTATARGYIWSLQPNATQAQVRWAQARHVGKRLAAEVVLFSSCGRRIATYRSMREAAHDASLPLSSVSKSCRGVKACVKSRKYGLCRFRYASAAPSKLDELDEAVIRLGKQAVAQYTLEGERIALHASIRNAAKAVSRHENSITNVLRGRAKTCAGYQWRAHSDSRPAPISLKQIKAKAVVCRYDYHGNLLARYESCAAAAKAVERALSTIWQAVKGITYSAAGSYWRRFPEGRVPDRIATPPPRQV
jgi:plasmid maintenance system antidote protein VapI